MHSNGTDEAETGRDESGDEILNFAIVRILNLDRAGTVNRLPLPGIDLRLLEIDRRLPGIDRISKPEMSRPEILHQLPIPTAFLQLRHPLRLRLPCQIRRRLLGVERGKSGGCQSGSTFSN